MRTAIILGRKHGAKTMELVHGLENPIHEQSATFKAEYCQSEIHEEFEYVELWISDEGLTKRRKLISPKQAKERAEAQAKAEAAAKAAATKAAAEAKKKDKANAKSADPEAQKKADAEAQAKAEA